MARLILILSGIACFSAAAASSIASSLVSAGAPATAKARSSATAAVTAGQVPALRPGVEPARCIGRAATTVNLAGSAAIDRIEVELASHSPEHGEADVRVRAGSSDRVVHVWGAVSRSLEFSPALAGDRVAITIEPGADLDLGPGAALDPGPDPAAARACVQRIKLMHRGVVVSEVTP